MLTLYFRPGASSMAPHIALHEVGAPFEGRPISFDKKETRRPPSWRINPEGKVPTLLIDGRVLTEVAGILFYLARRFPAAGLLPDGDVEAEAQVVSWMSFIASTDPSGAPPGAWSMRGRSTRWPTSGWAERLGGGRPLLDRRHPPVPALLALPQFAQPAPGEFPNIEAHYTRMMARPAVKKTIEIESEIGYELPA